MTLLILMWLCVDPYSALRCILCPDFLCKVMWCVMWLDDLCETDMPSCVCMGLLGALARNPLHWGWLGTLRWLLMSCLCCEHSITEILNGCTCLRVKTNEVIAVFPFCLSVILLFSHLSCVVVIFYNKVSEECLFLLDTGWLFDESEKNLQYSNVGVFLSISSGVPFSFCFS